MTSQQKVAAFMEWMNDQVLAGILQTTKMQQIGSSANAAWTDMYVSDSYKRGVQRARYEMGSSGMEIPPLEATGGIAASMGTPFHMDRVGVLYTRTFSELKGITSSMDSQLSRILSQGIIDGDNPKLLAKKLLRTISGPSGDLGITDSLGRYIPAERRAMMLARTEVIRAHHQGMVQEYKNWALEGVVVKAEWRTAGFEVCPQCAEMQGKIFTLNQIENMIPAHPNCRCIAVPTMPEDDD
jgi:SPP1 gp7 family putative phage head morphogenesis protein